MTALAGPGTFQAAFRVDRVCGLDRGQPNPSVHSYSPAHARAREPWNLKLEVNPGRSFYMLLCLTAVPGVTTRPTVALRRHVPVPWALGPSALANVGRAPLKLTDQHHDEH